MGGFSHIASSPSDSAPLVPAEGNRRFIFCQRLYIQIWSRYGSLITAFFVSNGTVDRVECDRTTNIVCSTKPQGFFPSMFETESVSLVYPRPSLQKSLQR